MKLRTSQSGVSIVEILIVIVVLGLIGFIGYNFYAKQSDKPADDSTSQTATAKDIPTAPEVTSTNDLDKASAMLDGSDTSSSSDSAELDSQLQAF